MGMAMKTLIMNGISLQLVVEWKGQSISIK